MGRWSINNWCLTPVFSWILKPPVKVIHLFSVTQFNRSPEWLQSIWNKYPSKNRMGILRQFVCSFEEVVESYLTRSEKMWIRKNLMHKECQGVRQNLCKLFCCWKQNRSASQLIWLMLLCRTYSYPKYPPRSLKIDWLIVTLLLLVVGWQ